MNKPVFFEQVILDLSKTLIYKFHYDHMRSKYGSKITADTNSVVYDIETEDLYRDIAKDIVTKFDTSRYLKIYNRPLPIQKNKKIIDIIKDEVGGKIMTEFIA